MLCYSGWTPLNKKGKQLMGLSTAIGLTDTDLTLEQQLSIHFSSNCYPPIPQQMIPTAIEAIDAYWEMDYNKMIPLPEGVSFRGQTEVSAANVIESYRLDAWCMDDYDE
jgi:hypothetical protein